MLEPPGPPSPLCLLSGAFLGGRFLWRAPGRHFQGLLGLRRWESSSESFPSILTAPNVGVKASHSVVLVYSRSYAATVSTFHHLLKESLTHQQISPSPLPQLWTPLTHLCLCGSHDAGHFRSVASQSLWSLVSDFLH